jgi:phage shock protein A
MTNTAPSSSAPYQREGSFRDRARQAIATGDQAAARALLHQLFVEEPGDGLSASVTDAVVATASAERDVAARERYQQTQRKLHDVLGWLDTADLDDDDLARVRRQVDRRATAIEAAAKDRDADKRAMVSGGTQRRRTDATASGAISGPPSSAAISAMRPPRTKTPR